MADADAGFHRLAKPSTVLVLVDDPLGRDVLAHEADRLHGGEVVAQRDPGALEQGCSVGTAPGSGKSAARP